MNFSKELQSLFNDAIDINDTIWYSKTETLYEAIVHLHNKSIKEELKWR